MNTIFLDVDGVLADFISAAIRHHKLPLTHDEVNSWDFHKPHGLTDGDLFGPMGEDFWASLHPYPEAGDLVSMVESMFEHERILLCTIPCLTPGCATGKVRWIEKHWPRYSRKVILLEDKSLLADSKRILIDDSDKNIDTWVNAGGVGVLFPRPWNRGKRKKDPIRSVKKELRKLQKGS